MSPYTTAKSFYCACKGNGIILDTNMLILYIVGSLGEEAVSKEKLLNSGKHLHSFEDYKIVKLLVDISNGHRFFFTSYTIPETFYLLDIKGARLGRNRKAKKCVDPCSEAAISTICAANELVSSTKGLLVNYGNLLEQFDVADLSIIHSINPTKPMAVLTDDSQLCDLLSGNSVPAMSLARMHGLDITSSNLIAKMPNLSV